MLQEQPAVPWECLCVQELHGLIWEAASQAQVSTLMALASFLLSNIDLLLGTALLANLPMKCRAQAL